MAIEQLGAAELTRLRDMIDRAEIDEVHNDYFHAMDTRNFDLLSRVFAPDAIFTASLIGHAKVTARGFDDVRATIRNVAMYRTSHHRTCNRSIILNGNEASAVVVARDALLDTAPRLADAVVGCRLVQHGLRYTDQLVRTSHGWRIRERDLVCLWQQVTVNPPYMDPLPF